MKLSYRPLTINDCDRLINLLTERPYLFNGYHDPEWHEKSLSRAPGWLENPLFFIPGVWFNDDLLAAIILKES